MFNWDNNVKGLRRHLQTKPKETSTNLTFLKRKLKKKVTPKQKLTEKAATCFKNEKVAFASYQVLPIIAKFSKPRTNCVIFNSACCENKVKKETKN